MKIYKNKYFKELTTFGVGGKIKYFSEVEDLNQVDKIVKFAKDQKLPIFILGGGSDILVSDKSFEGIVIKVINSKLIVEGNTVTAGAGLLWDNLVAETVKLNLQGIECLSGIPGLVGAAPIQNIGAYGQELKDSFISLKAYDIEKEKEVIFENKDCEFSYRDSIFKSKKYWQKFVILEIVLKLVPGGQPLIKYDSLKNYMQTKGLENINLQVVRDAVLTVRKDKFEEPEQVGNAGSFFKNPVVQKNIAQDLIKKYPNISCRQQPDGSYKCFAGWFIEQAGWKGKIYKSAGVSPKHALVLINPKGTATASDLIELSETITKDVYKKFGVKLEKEVQLINF